MVCTYSGKRIAILVTALLAWISQSRAQTSLLFIANLSGSNAVPPSASMTTGCGQFALYDNLLYVTIFADSYNAYNVTINGPALPDQKSDPIFTLGFNEGGSTWVAEIFLSPQEISHLMAGLWYVRADTSAGEIRGQILLLPEHDSDGDGISDDLDLCPGTPPFSIVDTDGCSIEQLSPCDGPWKNRGDYFRHMARVTAQFVQDGAITSAERRRLLRKAAKSDCGR